MIPGKLKSSSKVIRAFLLAILFIWTTVFALTPKAVIAVNGTIPAITLSGGVTEVKASRTLTVNVTPSASESIVIGGCTINFDLLNGNDSTNCIGGSASVSVDNPDFSPRTASQIATVMRTLTNVSDSAHGALVVGGGGNDVAFTTAGTEISATAISFTDNTGGDISSTSSTTGVIGIAASTTIAITSPLAANPADHSVEVDSLGAIDLGTSALSAASVAQTIRTGIAGAAGYPAKNYFITGSGANIVFTRESTGASGNGSITINDNTYTSVSETGVMSSTNYVIQSDSVNNSGVRSVSSSYRIEDTVGEIATGESSSSNYKLKAGYQQMQETFLAVSAAADVTMSGSLGGVSGGTSNGQTSITVTTDSSGGYELYIKASSSPAMQGNSEGGNISNYTPAGANPDFTFSVASNAGEFGFTPEGSDISQEYRDNGSSACNTGSSDTSNACWNALTTTNELISHSATSTHPNGAATTVKFRITLGSANLTIEDTYTATSTLTAVSL